MENNYDCHGGQSYLKSQKWLIWIEVTNAWVGMDMNPSNDMQPSWNIHAICYVFFER